MSAALDLTVHAELATDYFTLRGLDVEQQLLDHTVADYARALQLTQNLYHGGAAAIADVQQAQAQLETARTQAEDTRLRRAQTEHAIAVLVGREAFRLQRRRARGRRPAGCRSSRPACPPSCSSAVRTSRPRSGVSRRPMPASAWRAPPTFRCSVCLAGRRRRAPRPPTGSAPRASSGRSVRRRCSRSSTAACTRAQSAAAHAAYDEQVANYRGTVLTAFQDVEDNLAALRQLQRESVSQAAAVDRDAGCARSGEPALQGRHRHLPRGRGDRERRARRAARGGRHRDPPRQRHGAAGQGAGRGLEAARPASRQAPRARRAASGPRTVPGQPACDSAGDSCADDRRHPEQPQLRQRPTTHEDRRRRCCAQD